MPEQRGVEGDNQRYGTHAARSGLHEECLRIPNGINQSQYILDGRLRQDTVAQVKDVARPAACHIQDVARTPADFFGI